MAEIGEKLRDAAKTRASLSRLSQRRPLQADWIAWSGADNLAITKSSRFCVKIQLHTVCEGSFVSEHRRVLRQGTATLHDHGDICTRCCPFCDVGHGRLMPLGVCRNRSIWRRLIAKLRLKYVVITTRIGTICATAAHDISSIVSTRCVSYRPDAHRNPDSGLPRSP